MAQIVLVLGLVSPFFLEQTSGAFSPMTAEKFLYEKHLEARNLGQHQHGAKGEREEVGKERRERKESGVERICSPMRNRPGDGNLVWECTFSHLPMTSTTRREHCAFSKGCCTSANGAVNRSCVSACSPEHCPCWSPEVEYIAATLLWLSSPRTHFP